MVIMLHVEIFNLKHFFCKSIRIYWLVCSIGDHDQTKYAGVLEINCHCLGYICSLSLLTSLKILDNIFSKKGFASLIKESIFCRFRVKMPNEDIAWTNSLSLVNCRLRMNIIQLNIYYMGKKQVFSIIFLLLFIIVLGYGFFWITRRQNIPAQLKETPFALMPPPTRFVSENSPANHG